MKRDRDLSTSPSSFHLLSTTSPLLSINCSAPLVASQVNATSALSVSRSCSASCTLLFIRAATTTASRCRSSTPSDSFGVKDSLALSKYLFIALEHCLL
ncbi:hypothetical protein Q3G72_032262 [Acer saccharum]|nr:hypothetical protein Q3G72_032262 [Acer saccharum]